MKKSVFVVSALLLIAASFASAQGVSGDDFSKGTETEALRFFSVEGKSHVQKGGIFFDIRDNRDALISEYRKARNLDRKQKMVAELQKDLVPAICGNGSSLEIAKQLSDIDLDNLLSKVGKIKIASISNLKSNEFENLVKGNDGKPQTGTTKPRASK